MTPRFWNLTGGARSWTVPVCTRVGECHKSLRVSRARPVTKHHGAAAQGFIAESECQSDSECGMQRCFVAIKPNSCLLGEFGHDRFRGPVCIKAQCQDRYCVLSDSFTSLWVCLWLLQDLYDFNASVGECTCESPKDCGREARGLESCLQDLCCTVVKKAKEISRQLENSSITSCANSCAENPACQAFEGQRSCSRAGKP